MNAPGTGVRNGADVESLLRRHPGVMGYLAGHEHRNRIEPHGSFWELVTASHLEWPQQSRLLEVARQGRSRSTRPRSTTTPGRDRIARAAWRDWRRSRPGWRSTSHRRRTARTARRIAAGRRSTATSPSSYRIRTERPLRCTTEDAARQTTPLQHHHRRRTAHAVRRRRRGEGRSYLKSCYASPNGTPVHPARPGGPGRGRGAEPGRPASPTPPSGTSAAATTTCASSTSASAGRSRSVPAQRRRPTKHPRTSTSARTAEAHTSPRATSSSCSAGTPARVRSGSCSARAPMCTPVTAATSFESVAVDPDSANVYARGANQLVVFDRNPGSGTLSQKLGLAGCFAEESALPARPRPASQARVTRRRSRRTAEPSTCPIRHRAGSPCSAAPRTDRSQPGGAGGGCVTAGGTSGALGGAECLSGSSTLAQATAVNVDAQGAT